MKIGLSSLTILSSLFLPALGLVGYYCGSDTITSDMTDNAIGESMRVAREKPDGYLQNLPINAQIEFQIQFNSRQEPGNTFWVTHNKRGDLRSVYYISQGHKSDCPNKSLEIYSQGSFFE
ncbi:BgTH12-00036 [Blumeria graminis f. sp. triticale]|uniref:Bgt-20383 n=3 Tax=Blumeria graminis TaxID=34373 RepID=A0A9X9MKW1_BLUGR|nr:BgTH12-00036 [Blumeria graminis f. sp. triticale]VDB92471.1 Bgt-20383 [Blumeria graminis f. sp. tritici]